MANETITAPQGFLAAGLSCGIKASGKADIALLTCPTGAKAAAVFTTNTIVSAGVHVCRDHLASRTIYGVVVNSGNANACTGKQGLANAKMMCLAAAGGIKAEPAQVLVASTGIIGHPLPMDKLTQGVRQAASRNTLGRAGVKQHFARS